MNWIYITFIILIVVNIVSFVIEFVCRKKLKNIDGATGISKRKENIIGSNEDDWRKKR